MSPSVGVSRRTTQRPSVDLPQPDSPTRPTVSPCATASVTSSTAWTRSTSRWRTPCRIGKYFFRLWISSERAVAVLLRTFAHAAPTASPANVVTRRRFFSSTVSQQRSRWPLLLDAVLEVGLVVALSKACGQRGGTCSPAAG